MPTKLINAFKFIATTSKSKKKLAGSTVPKLLVRTYYTCLLVKCQLYFLHLYGPQFQSFLSLISWSHFPIKSSTVCGHLTGSPCWSQMRRCRCCYQLWTFPIIICRSFPPVFYTRFRVSSFILPSASPSLSLPFLGHFAFTLLLLSLSSLSLLWRPFLTAAAAALAQ